METLHNTDGVVTKKLTYGDGGTCTHVPPLPTPLGSELRPTVLQCDGTSHLFHNLPLSFRFLYRHKTGDRGTGVWTTWPITLQAAVANLEWNRPPLDRKFDAIYRRATTRNSPVQMWT